MKITIEEEGRETTVLTDVENLVLVSESGAGNELIMTCSEMFLGFAAARVSAAFTKVVNEIEEPIIEEVLS